jgi:hypothetical protein
MTNEEYKQLESLLGKLEMEVGEKICIIPNYIHDGYHIGVYSRITGKPYKQASGPTIAETVQQLAIK